MKRKARRTREVALLLLARAHDDDAASRLYFAFLQAAVHCLEKTGRRPSDFRRDATWWGYRMLVDLVPLLRGRYDDAHLFLRIRALRIQADYGGASVERREVERLRHEVYRFVEEVTG